jgi:hypothetical protein
MKKKGKRERQRETIRALELTRVESAQSLLKNLTAAAPAAIHFKKALLDDPLCPDYLKLQNANDILDRTLPKPIQRIQMDSINLNSNMSEREVRELLQRKIQQKAIEMSSEDVSNG